jgi:ABC-type uncharacterized transport system auxiliary subunit
MRLVVIALALLALAGCAPDHGTVTARKTGIDCPTSNALSCSPEWKVLITDPNARHPVYTDRPDSGWARVSEEQYGRCQIGAAWLDCKTRLR